MARSYAFPISPIMLGFVKHLGAAFKQALVPMVSFIVLPLILCTMHSESADIALAGIVNILAVIHTLHIVAYLTFALMARSCAYPVAPNMLGFAISPSAAFYRACMPMSTLIARPVGSPLMLVRLLISASTYAIDEGMLGFAKPHLALFKYARMPMMGCIVLPYIFIPPAGGTALFRSLAQIACALMLSSC